MGATYENLPAFIGESFEKIINLQKMSVAKRLAIGCSVLCTGLLSTFHGRRVRNRIVLHINYHGSALLALYRENVFEVSAV